MQTPENQVLNFPNKSVRIQIREAVDGDVPAIIEMGRSFFDASGYSGIIAFDAKTAKTAIETIIIDKHAIILVAEIHEQLIGMVAAILHPFYFNINHLTGQELVWWIEPEHRTGTAGIRLIKAIEQWAKSNGAKTFSMISLANNRRVEQIYERRGYLPSENTFIKSL